MAYELVNGSRFVNDKTVGDAYGGSVRVEGYAASPVIVIESDNSGSYSAYVADVLTLIDNAGLDPVRTAARELVELCKPVNMHSDIGRRSIIEAAEKLKGLL